jgi:hypothetical protein
MRWTVAVPPTPLRAGARRGKLSPTVRQALQAEAAAIAAIEDPLQRITAIGDAFAGFDSELARMAKVRLTAVRELRDQGWSYDRLAAATGLSKGRIAQLCRDPRGGSGSGKDRRSVPPRST